jgi:hypothetical protein
MQPTDLFWCIAVAIALYAAVMFYTKFRVEVTP